MSENKRARGTGLYSVNKAIRMVQEELEESKVVVTMQEATIDGLEAYKRLLQRKHNCQPICCFSRVSSTVKRNGSYHWDLTWEQAEKYADQPCHDCGHVPTETDARWAVRPLDKALGYTDGNVVPVCVQCSYKHRIANRKTPKARE